MKKLLTLFGGCVLAAIILFFSSWCWSIVYTSIIPVLLMFNLPTPDLSFGVFVLLTLVMGLISTRKFKPDNKQMDLNSPETIRFIIERVINMILYTGLIALTSHLVF